MARTNFAPSGASKRSGEDARSALVVVQQIAANVRSGVTGLKQQLSGGQISIEQYNQQVAGFAPQIKSLRMLAGRIDQRAQAELAEARANPGRADAADLALAGDQDSRVAAGMQQQAQDLERMIAPIAPVQTAKQGEVASPAEIQAPGRNVEPEPQAAADRPAGERKSAAAIETLKKQLEELEQMSAPDED